jgi:hypothetical protein
MSWIVDRIVSVDAPVATLAERASIEMLDARRFERNYFLLHDPVDLQNNRQSLSQLEEIINTCRDLQPEERTTTQKMLDDLGRYRERLEAAVARLTEPGQAPLGRLQTVIQAYEKDLNDLLRRARRESRERLIDDLRNRVGSFDAQITQTLQMEDPTLRQATKDLQNSSQEILRLASDLETRSWDRVQRDHLEARRLVRRAEKVLIVVSSLTLLLSVLVSFILPKEVVNPLVDLKAAVDHAAAGNYEIDFDVQGDGEVVQLADSVRNLIASVRHKKENSSSHDVPKKVIEG